MGICGGTDNFDLFLVGWLCVYGVGSEFCDGVGCGPGGGVVLAFWSVGVGVFVEGLLRNAKKEPPERSRIRMFCGGNSSFLSLSKSRTDTAADGG